MNRFFGMMPEKFVEIRKTYSDDLGLPVIIEAGPYGWTIIWADDSTTYKDVNATSEENFNEAYNEVIRHLNVKEVKVDEREDVMEEK